MKKYAIAAFITLFIAPVGFTALVNAETLHPATSINQPSSSTQRSSQFRVISDDDWRSTSPNVPWSIPVIVRDDFSGDYLAVFDHNFVDHRRTEDGVVSNWSRDYIRVFTYHKERECGAIPVFCHGARTEVLESNRLEVKVGDRVFTLEGQDGNFPVNDELATALANAPIGDAKIRIGLEESGALITNDIGEETVKAWSVVYGSNPSS